MSVPGVPDVNPRLGLPSSRRSRLFREIVRMLRADADLDAAVRTWQAWDGDQDADDDPPASACPCVRLTPQGGPAETRDNISQQGTLRWDVEVWTAGLDAEDPLDLWAAIENVIFPADVDEQRSIRDRLRSLGGTGTDIKVSEPAQISRVGPGGAVMKAEGGFTYTYRIQG